eukprot:11332_2
MIARVYLVQERCPVALGQHRESLSLSQRYQRPRNMILSSSVFVFAFELQSLLLVFQTQWIQMDQYSLCPWQKDFLQTPLK